VSQIFPAPAECHVRRQCSRLPPLPRRIA
jgi:hypothetical protein